MTIPVSTVPAVRAFLLAAIATQINDTGVSVTNGQPGMNRTDDLVAILDVTRQAAMSAMVGGGGQHAIEEHYTVQIGVTCYRGGDAIATVDARAWALASAVETAVRNDLTLGGNVYLAKPGVSQSSGPYWDEDHKGVICDVFVNIDCNAQL